MANEEVKPVTLGDFFKAQCLKESKQDLKKLKKLNKQKANENSNTKRG